jgi:hypothetical protein
MRATQEAHMFDECVIQHATKTPNRLNEQIESFTDATVPTKCGLDMRPGSMRWGAQQVTLVYDATMRLPIGTVIVASDRIKVTKRFSETLSTALVFFIVGPVQRGPSGIRLLLHRVEV